MKLVLGFNFYLSRSRYQSIYFLQTCEFERITTSIVPLSVGLVPVGLTCTSAFVSYPAIFVLIVLSVYLTVAI